MMLSAVIPSWQEAGWIEASVAAARAVADEVIVADGGSTDATQALARRAGARVIVAPRGRGQQLAAGARAASGDVLLFLHADTYLPPEARRAIARALEAPELVGGNFFLRFEPPTTIGRLFTRIYDLRRRSLGIYYGDSPLFVRRSVYERLGGFPSQALFEDYAFARRLARAGRTRYVRDVAAVTSGRRYEARPLQTLVLWVGLQALYSAGIAPDRLARFYAAVRARPGSTLPGPEPTGRAGSALVAAAPNRDESV
jgi:rSAM/selenodomain-associated transferase 2